MDLLYNIAFWLTYVSLPFIIMFHIGYANTFRHDYGTNPKYFTHMLFAVMQALMFGFLTAAIIIVSTN